MRRPLNETRFGDDTAKKMPVVHVISQQSEVVHAMLMEPVFDGNVIPESMLCVEQLNVMSKILSRPLDVPRLDPMRPSMASCVNECCVVDGACPILSACGLMWRVFDGESRVALCTSFKEFDPSFPPKIVITNFCVPDGVHTTAE